jgi:tetratricopeptide (TPR) repeat protein
VSAPASPPPSERRGLLIAAVGPAEPLDAEGAVYRTLQPCRALGELAEISVVSGSMLSPPLIDAGLLLTADVLVIRDVADPDLLPIIAARRRQGRLTAYELTEHPYAPPPRQAELPRRDSDLIARSLRPLLARQSDCVQFATEALEAQLGTLNGRRAVFPSQLWEAPPPPPLRRIDRVVIGWGGPRAHSDDLRGVMPALVGIMDRHPEVELAVMGDPAVQPLLASLPADRVSFRRWGRLVDYYRFLDTLDIGLGPLSSSPYDRCRGDIRFVEYAAHGVLAICAELEPYRDVVRPGNTGYLYRDVAELETVLERALAEAEMRTAIPARAARYVATERVERAHAPTRLGFYLSIAAQIGMTLGPGARRAPFPAPELMDERAAPLTFPDSRYVALGRGEIERLLADGAAARLAGDATEARRCFEAAAPLAPASHLPLLGLGGVAPAAEAAAALARAETLGPLSCQVPYLRGVRLLELGDGAGAIAALERARAIAPSFGAPQERLGAIAEAAGKIDEACRLYEEAALQNGSFALPIARLATLAQRDGKLDKAVGLLERTLGSDPDLWLTNFLVGRAYVEQKRFHQARVHLLRALDGAPTATDAQGAADRHDRAAVLTTLAKAEAGLGNNDAAREALEQAQQPVVKAAASVTTD